MVTASPPRLVTLRDHCLLRHLRARNGFRTERFDSLRAVVLHLRALARRAITATTPPRYVIAREERTQRTQGNPMIHYCPTCAGPQMLDHPAGILTYRHSNDCELRAHEDGIRVADSERFWSRFERPATATERLLLTSQGFTVPADLVTAVQFLTPGVARRTWPALGVPA
jgi:hypothetical protein